MTSFKILFFVAAMVLLGGNAYAACSSPAGENTYNRRDGETTYTCDGTTWNAVSSAASASGASGSVQFSDGSSLASDNSNLYWDDTNKRLGIGTASPGKELDVAGSVSATAIASEAFNIGSLSGAYFQAQDGNPVLAFDANDYFSYNRSTDLLQFSSGGTAPFVINSSGNVGIGTTSPSQKLSVAGTIESTSGGIKFPDGTTQTTAASGGGSASCRVKMQTSISGNGIEASSGSSTSSYSSGGTEQCTSYMDIGGGAYNDEGLVTQRVRMRVCIQCQ